MFKNQGWELLGWPQLAHSIPLVCVSTGTVEAGWTGQQQPLVLMRYWAAAELT